MCVVPVFASRQSMSRILICSRSLHSHTLACTLFQSCLESRVVDLMKSHIWTVHASPAQRSLLLPVFVSGGQRESRIDAQWIGWKKKYEKCFFLFSLRLVTGCRERTIKSKKRLASRVSGKERGEVRTCHASMSSMRRRLVINEQ